MKDPSLTITDFARDILGKPLYPYQIEIAEAIVRSIVDGEGRIFTVMMARQSGKNQLSAVLEAYLLYQYPKGTIVKAAPTYRPQIMHSRHRLISLLSGCSLQQRFWQNGPQVGLAPEGDPSLLRNRAGPRVMFFSASPESNVVGATADLLLEIDEAQDVQHEKFNRDFRPMASTTNATTVLYGTAWSDTTLLAQQSAANQELQERTGQRQHFAYDWQALAAINPAYRRYVEQEIERLGEDHIAIQTQYLLHTLSGADYFLTDLHRIMLQGTHAWENEPGEGLYIAGMDVAGEDRPTPITSTSAGHTAPPRSRRDSTVITIARLCLDDLNFPVAEVVHHEWWTGRPFPEQHHATISLIEHWGIRSLIIDDTGLGEAFASHLQNILGTHRIKRIKFTRPTKSHLGNQMLKFIRCGQLKLYAAENAPRRIFEECHQQLRNARQRLLPSQMVDFYVDPSDGHDDFLISLALLIEAASPFTSESPSTFIRPKKEYSNESQF
ncbi:MAG TPA: hypothetical protein VFB12_14955 [Ktedonobacteraceae bacterium]|nr:hypothetical protein [Ktedonobacteraceae bacterium]